MSRRKDVQWNIPEGQLDIAQAQIAVLMDIRDELKAANGYLGRIVRCPNIQRAFRTLERIDRRLAKKRGRR